MVDYDAFKGIGEKEEDEEIKGVLEDLAAHHLEYMASRSSHASSSNSSDSSSIVEDFKKEMESISARGEFVAREARRSIKEARRGKKCRLLNDAEKARIESEMDILLD